MAYFAAKSLVDVLDLKNQRSPSHKNRTLYDHVPTQRSELLEPITTMYDDSRVLPELIPKLNFPGFEGWGRYVPQEFPKALPRLPLLP